MRPILILILSMGLFPLTAFARLGETSDQLEKRFGPPSPVKPAVQIIAQGRIYKIGQTLNFSSEDWSVSCVMINGTCAQITYGKTGDLTDAQVTTLLNNEAQGSTWTESVSYTTVVDNLLLPHLHVREWKRADGAVASKTGNRITLTNPEYDKAVATAKQQGLDAAQKMPGNL